jgi:glycosyltransferase involved in cell wall biosynthesis
VRLAVYTDYLYHRVDGQVHAERAFALFLAALATRVERLVLVGRLHPGGGSARYPLGDVDLVPLPYYESLARPREAMGGLLGSLRAFWGALDDVDAVWLLGPHPLVFAYAAMALARRRRVVLGVRQEFVELMRTRHPGRRALQLAGSLMELGFRLMSRALPVVVVGPRLADSYRHSRSLLEIVVSVVPAAEVVAGPDAPGRDYSGEITVLSVGRLDAEKNPLAMADVLRLLQDGSGDWRLIVCGEGPLEQPLRERLAELGLAGRSELRGYVSNDDGLRELYLSSDLLLHVSWTEGVPQVLYEAFAAALPVVATDVGGVAASTGDAAVLVPPGEPTAAAEALRRVAGDPGLRRALAERGLELARASSLESETERVAAFLADPSRPTPPARLAAG